MEEAASGREEKECRQGARKKEVDRECKLSVMFSANETRGMLGSLRDDATGHPAKVSREEPQEQVRISTTTSSFLPKEGIFQVDIKPPRFDMPRAKFE